MSGESQNNPTIAINKENALIQVFFNQYLCISLGGLQKKTPKNNFLRVFEVVFKDLSPNLKQIGACDD